MPTPNPLGTKETGHNGGMRRRCWEDRNPASSYKVHRCVCVCVRVSPWEGTALVQGQRAVSIGE